MYIKKNIKRLIQNMLTEKDGAPLKSFIGPMDMIELPASKGFGYIMERVDLNQYLSVPQLRHKDKFPDAETICKIGINITHFFARVHISGLCYKDINEGNVYIHPKTGEIIVLDCDNISTQHTTTIKGTTCYMAPEVYGGVNPDIYTDYHSMAVLFYRILTGGYPFAGKWAQKYMLDNELSEMEAAPVVYGSRALFVFDLKDKSNTIKGLVDPQKPNLYKAQELSWELLPEELKNLFVKTFSTGLKEKDRIKRASDTEWKKAFENIQKNGIVKCRCGKTAFGSRTEKKKCLFCRKELPMLPPKPGKELTTVVFIAKRDIAPTHLRITAQRKVELSGKKIHPSLNEGWMKIQYNSKRNLLGAINNSRYTWKVIDGNSKTTCAPGERVVLKKDLKIVVLWHQLELTVSEIK